MSAINFAVIDAICSEIKQERLNQHLRFGQQDLPDGVGDCEARRTYRLLAQLACDRATREGRLTYQLIHEEEGSEIYDARTKAELRAELIQQAAVNIQWIEKLDRELARQKP